MVKTSLRTHGGKAYLATKIVEVLNRVKHTRYLEAFAGGLSVLFAKPYEGISEYANDLNGELANFWLAIRDSPEQLIAILHNTPLSQDVFNGALSQTTYVSHVHRAAAFFIRARQSRQGLGKDYCTPTSRTRRGMNENVSAWLSAVEGLPEVHERLKRVEIWNRPAIKAIKDLDSPELLVYCDPPYVHSTRSTKSEYGAFEMSDVEHEILLTAITRMKGYCVISGYPCDLYEDYIGRWNKLSLATPNHASSAKVKEAKPETIWFNF